MARLEEWFRAWARGRGVGIARQLVKETQDVLSVPAPHPPGRANPFAPPRLVTGYLRSSVRLVRTVFGARVVVWAPYGVFLEKSMRWFGWPHKFLAVAMRRLGIHGRSNP